MPLTELIITGFKSFAQKTTIKFDNGITGIVGPNGSGKSNITEAIRWVMGEASAKSLRGSNMKDIIFAGSEYRQPANHAEVTLIFDNCGHELNIDAQTVTVTRSILRSGESDYFINQQNVRQKDVRALFLDSGVSQDSLAIISQGRVDQILNSRPAERRGLFEEAAGILAFKKQKEEATSQLEQTTENLIRINDLVKELAQRIEPLQEQSSLAQEFLFQKKGLDQDLKTLLAFEIDAFAQQKRTVQTKADQNQVLLSKLDREVKESQGAVTAKRKESQQLSAHREQLQTDLLALTKKLSELNTNLQVTEQSKQYNEATRQEYQTELADLHKQIQNLHTACQELTAQEDQVHSQKQKLQQQRAKLTGQLDDNPAQLTQQLETLRSDYIQLLQDQTSNNNQIVYLTTELQRTRDDRGEQNNDVEKQLANGAAELKRLADQDQELKAKQQAAKAALAQLTDEQGQNQLQLEQTRQTVAAQSQRYSQICARYEALEHIRKRHEGYYYGVRNVLNNLAAYPGVIGAIGELLSFPAELEAAMATALGSGVQDLVTTTKNSARDAIKQLKAKHGGRATFLPLDGLNDYTIPPSTVKLMQTYAGYQGIASQLVTSESQQDISAAVNYLLGTTVIVDTIDHALSLRQRIARYRIVTLDGDVISPGGSMTGGARNQKSNSPLQTTAELNKLQQTMTSLKEQLNRKQTELTQLSTTTADLEQKIKLGQTQEQAVSRDLGEVRLSYQSQEKEVHRLQAANQLQQIHLKERADQITALNDQIAAAKKTKADLFRQIEQQKTAISNLQARIQNCTDLNQTVQQQLAELDPQLAVFKNKLENLTKEQKTKQDELTQRKKQVETVTAKLQALDQTSELDQQKKEQMIKEQAAATQKQAEVQAQINDLSSQLGQFDAKINQLDQLASRNYDLRKAAAAEQERLAVQLAQFNSQIDQRLEQLRQDYALTYEAALAQAQGENNEEARLQLQKSVKLHQMSLAEIGPVNLKAIEEYEQVKQRYDFLNNQQTDLLKGRDNLQESMAELDEEVCSRFSQTFTAVAQSFSDLFPVVFGGGSAKLVLTAPADLLTTGVEIIAQPPGKKLQQLSLLSGGERALTAITLLFAMLKVKPVPFCVLDEVEAALDDANVARFAQFLEKYDLQTQFIVITHRRGTMERADQLYGVVMQESGVSQVLSVSLKELKNEVN